jgi:hypothetical protein
MNLAKVEIRGKQAPLPNWEAISQGMERKPFCVNVIDRDETTSYHFEIPMGANGFLLNGQMVDVGLHPPSAPLLIERLGDNLCRMTIELFIEPPVIEMEDRDAS